MEKVPATKNKERLEGRSEAVGYAKSEHIEINENSYVELLKVRHILNTLDEYKDEIEKLISEASVLVSEMYVPTEEDSEEELSEMELFYREVTQMAESSGVPVIVADPEKEMSDAILNRTVSVAPGMATIGSGAYILKKFADIKAEISYKSNEENKTSSMSRRNFLKLGAVSTVAAAGGLNTLAGLLEELGVSEGKGEFLEKFVHDSLDYRNALVAKKILELAETSEKVSVIYGATHAPGFKKYLSNPDLLEEKLLVYEYTYGLFNDDNPEEYTH